MRRTLLTIVILFISASTFIFSQITSGQNSLPASRRSSSELFVYKLDRKDVRNLYLKEKNLEESMLHTFVMRCTEAKDIPALPRGNYIWVKVVDNNLEYSDHTVDNFHHSIVEDEKVMLFLSDTLGNVISNAVVRQGLKRLKFDEITQTYNTSRIGDEKIVEVNNGGVLHYIEFEKESAYYYRNNFFRSSWYKIMNGFYRVFEPDRAYIQDKYDGFVVFSKPKYKPGETVRFKAYINHNGRPYNEKTEVSLVSYYPVRIDTTLTTLQPYRPGMYEWEFLLSDSLKLHLDNSYNIVLKTRGKHTNDIIGNFYYEEYELGRISFEAKADREKYVKGDTVKLQFRASDENGMPVYDGRVDITIRPSKRSERKYYADRAFIPDEIWRHSFDMNGKASEELVLPDSVFIPATGIYYDVECSFFDSGNEKHDQELTVYMDMRNRLIDFSVEKGILTIKELADGESTPVQAWVTAYNSEVEVMFRDSVKLPYSLPLLWIASDYEVMTETSSGEFCVTDIKKEILEYRFFREDGNVRLVVDNPSRFPFWYTIRKDKKIIDKGYVSELDYTCRDRGKNGYMMQLSYLLGEKARTITGSLPYVEKNLSMEVNTPTTVYPGQTTTVDVLVKDKKGRPVKNADITAYAFTSKFGSHSPNVTIYGKSVSGKRFNNTRYDISGTSPYNVRSPMEWAIWKERMGLDSIEYYKFLYPEICYSYSEKVSGEVTQIAPYVVIDGIPQGVHILWIDEQPHYFHQARQLDVYSFPVTPGYHTLKFRTYDREITVEDVHAREGMKTILSVNGEKSAVLPDTNEETDGPPLQVTVKKYDRKNRGLLSEREMVLLEDHMITVDNTTGTATLPNDQPVYTPAIMNAGGIYYWLNNSVARRYDYIARSYVMEPILAGPFPYRGFSTGGKNLGTLYVDTMFVNTFAIEGGYRYEIWKNYLKQTKWKQIPFSSKIKPFSPQLSFSQNALTAESIRDMFHALLLDRVQRKNGLMIPNNTSSASDSPDTKVNIRRETGLNMPVAKDHEDGCRLRLEIGYFADKKVTANPLMIRLSTSEDKNTARYIYYGGTRNFSKLPEGNYQIDLIFKDTTRYAVPVTLKENGLNYLKIDSVRPMPADSIGRNTFALLYSHLYISKPDTPLPDSTVYGGPDNVTTVPAETIGSFNSTNYTGEEITGTVLDESGEPLIGATVTIEGTTTGTVTDIDGRFRLPDTGSGNLFVSYIGYQPFTTRIIPGYDYQITLEEDYNALDEVVVVGFGTAKKEIMTGSEGILGLLDLFDSRELEGKLPGVVAGTQIRGTASIPDSSPLLIIINGVPYDGALSDLDPGNIASMNVVKDADTAIYGFRAANGVIFIETKDGVSPTVSPDDSGFPDGWDNANTLRTNFHDDAFWYPSLSTGSDGTVSFEVTYPDDITSWNANFIAVGGRKQTDKAQLNIKSFKPLNAQLSMPQFAILNDSLNVIGRLTNHLGDTVKIKRSIEWQGNRSEESITLLNSYVDTIPVFANESDSVSITYSMTMESGYFDGERRTIPIYQSGILESHGEFAVLGDTVSHRFRTNPALGKVTIHAEASAMQSFLDEIDRIDRYPYLCNEQIASKIKALLLKKRICPMFGMEFKEDNKIRSLLRRLERNKNSDNLWGWWNQDKTELWISKQIVEAMLDADADGYKVNFNKQGALDALIRELNRRLSIAKEVSDDSFIKHELLNLLELLRKLDAKIDYDQYFRLVSSLTDITVNDRLKSMQMALLLDVNDKPQVDSLLSLSSETMLGSVYWGEKEKEGIPPGHFMLPNVNNTENTLAAYRILRETGGYDEQLEKIRNYFFEIRKSGSWQNTYESARIMETIMPDMIKPEGSFSDARLTINGKQYEEFPLTAEFGAGEMIDVRKAGTIPIFFTVFQQAWNNTPDKASEGFSVETVFSDNDDIVTVLESGKSVDLKISITVDADAEYVMIEVPIPAGCSYESKNRENFWKETHREYYKEKVVIFCHKLSKGTHDFTIKLIPRFTGLYHLNPAKAELMYFPTFFGRGDTGKCEIQ
ncbi:carboxypeptidase-like regulatory domain-containing protein [uncultured Proteiniphilum sp.]|uniref:carboxypeptidase-like regulatory domain-containing protein n=1 Tax=uncultured Proteiniphilum sp. TaxID=497637 RepID=UPI0026136D3B|nr:carboxypeptidase-like regulatory domain-containing protein [uncultured Proteiniphilum sp.]